MWSKIKTHFFSGLVVFVPISLTLYFCYLLYVLISGLLRPLLTAQSWIVLPTFLVRPISFLLTLVLIWALGFMVSYFAGRRIVQLVEWFIHQIPVFSGFYDAIYKMTEAFFGSKNMYRSAVLVQYPRVGCYTIGFVTSELPGSLFNAAEPFYCVFIPTVPNPTSGILQYVPKSDTIPLTLTIEEVAKVIVSHGFVPLNAASVTIAPGQGPAHV